MPTHTLLRDPDPAQGSSPLRSKVTLVAAAAIGYVTGALVHSSLPPPNDSVAFARPVGAAVVGAGTTAPLAAIPVPSADTVRRSDAWSMEDPRECDATRGISTACVFMD